MSKKQIFKGSGVALITPMNSNGSVNFGMLEKLLEYQISNGTNAIITCGTTGEAAALSEKERNQVISFTIEKVAKRIPVIVGCGSNNTKIATKFALEAESMGADGLLIVTPYYNKASQSGLIEHYFYIADRVNTPIILYNVPSRTGVNIKPETYMKLSTHDNIVAAKEANGDISSVATTISKCGKENLWIYSGNDDQTVPILSLGGIGVISVFANIYPREMSRIVNDFLSSDISKIKNSIEIHLKFNEIMNALFCDVNPIPVKAAMKIIGYDCGDCRLPLGKISKENFEYLKSIIDKNII